MDHQHCTTESERKVIYAEKHFFLPFPFSWSHQVDQLTPGTDPLSIQYHSPDRLLHTSQTHCPPLSIPETLRPREWWGLIPIPTPTGLKYMMLNPSPWDFEAVLMCDCRKICEASVCTDQFEISFPTFQEALGLGIGWWLAQLSIHLFTCQAQTVKHRWILLWWTKMQMWSDSHPEITFPHPKSHSWKQSFWYWHVIKCALSHNSAACLYLKTRACTTAPLMMHHSHGLCPPARLKFPCGQSEWEGSGLVSKDIPSGYVKTVCCHSRGLQLSLHPCRTLIM